MPITDLTGYTWTASNDIASAFLDLAGQWGEASLNFVSNNQTFTALSFDAADYGSPMGGEPATIKYGNTEVYNTDDGWSNANYATIQITGGDNVEDEYLIELLESLGTLTPTAPSINDLTGTKWLINSTPVLSPLTYNQSDPMLGEYGQYDFEITGTSYDNVEIQGITLVGDQWGLTINIGMQIYDGEDWFEGEGFRTIEITGGNDVTNADLIAWLQANATQVVSATPSLNFGGSDVSLFLGSTYVSKMYLGSTLLYEGEAPTPSVTLISFEVGNTTYQAESGMTWEQWLASNYNINGFYSQYGYIQYSAHDYVVIADGSNTAVQPTDTIIDNGEYELYIAGGGND